MRPLQSFTALHLPETIAGRQEEGSALIELALLLPVFLLLLTGIADFGRGFLASIEISSAAQAAANYGMQQPTDVVGIQAAAAMGAADLSGVKTIVANGCQCSDGSSVQLDCVNPPTNCSANIVNYVQVTTTANYIPLFKFPGLPTLLTLQGKAQMRSVH